MPSCPRASGVSDAHTAAAVFWVGKRTQGDNHKGVQTNEHYLGGVGVGARARETREREREWEKAGGTADC